MGATDMLKNIQFYKKVHSDFTESTTTTGIISILAAMVMTFLFFSQLMQYLAISEDMSMVMDENTSEKLRINFNVTMQYLPCRFASVDVSDSHGDHYVNVTSHVAKWRIVSDLETGEHEKLSAKPMLDRRFEERTQEEEAPTPIPEAELNHYNDEDDAAVEITPENFDDLVKVHDLSMINFYAPWCHWSNRLKPVWEHTATFYKDNQRVLIGRCDCTKDANRPLCQRNHIMAFPTIRIFRSGQTHSHEYYDGERQTSAFMEYITKQLETITDSVVPKGDTDGSREPAKPVHLSADKKFRLQQDEDTSKGPEGCMLSGFLMVNRAPGNFHIQARSPDHSFNADNLNTSHVITSLTFGSPLSRREMSILSADIAPFINTLEDEYFVSNNFGVTREHYIKVVHTSYHKLNSRSPLSTYQYTTTDTEYTEHPPSAKFSFDLSPMQIVIKQSRQPLSTFVTSVCAIIGGVFTVIGLVDSVLYHSLNVLKKQQIGKLG